MLNSKSYNRHLTFLAQLADLKSADEMEVLMEAYALDTTSYTDFKNFR